MDGQPLISVIVPIYNVAPYLRKCLDSLKGQSLKEIEVICIDDGSTDESGDIADEYATDSRFRVIHTENRGLSAARNRGINEARTDWLMFVDSDDWVEPGFCENPYRAAVDNGAELVIFGSDNWKNRAPEGEIDEYTAHDCGRAVAWNKLYRHHLFIDIRYPEGRVYEDVATTHKIVHEAKRIFCLHECLYHYVDREKSISNSPTISNRRDGAISEFERCIDLLSYGYSEEKIREPLYRAAIGILSHANSEDAERYMKAKSIIGSIKAIPKSFSMKQKIALVVWKITERLFHLLCIAFGRAKHLYTKKCT